jgi:hypothetical protein
MGSNDTAHRTTCGVVIGVVRVPAFGNRFAFSEEQIVNVVDLDRANCHKLPGSVHGL